MKSKLILTGIIAVVLVVASVAFVLVLVYERIMRPPTPGIIEATLEQRVDKEHTASVVLSDLTDFDWDYVYAFPPYIGPNDVSSVLGEKLPITKDIRYGLNGGDVLVVFTRTEKVVYYELMPAKYRLYGADGSFTISKDRAVFKVTGYGGPYELHESR
ncbi:MAG: hypothetical protein ISS79_04825 [Phycisphaerae bacterium]|nr:hypothetical protein [Phycisphaerae bacterium]